MIEYRNFLISEVAILIFGYQFYPSLDKMTNWRQSLFALVLATRQYPNFELWTELEQCQGAQEFKQVLQLCWEYHFDKFNHIDLTEAFEIIAPYIPESQEEDGDLPNEGARFAFDAAISLNAAIEAIVIDTNEAANASKASMAAVIRLCEHKYTEEDLDEDNLLEKPEILDEIDFQVGLMELVQQPRTPELIMSLLKYALKEETSNIGFELNFQLEDFYRPEEWGKHTAQNKGNKAKAKDSFSNTKPKASSNQSKSTQTKAEKAKFYYDASKHNSTAEAKVIYSQAEQDLLDDLKDAGFDVDDLKASGFELIEEANELLAEDDDGDQSKSQESAHTTHRHSCFSNSRERKTHRQHGAGKERHSFSKNKHSGERHSGESISKEHSYNQYDKKRSDRPFGSERKDKKEHSAHFASGEKRGLIGEWPSRGRSHGQRSKSAHHAAKHTPRVWNSSARSE